jgi:phosphoesterase RecJ-like protein
LSETAERQEILRRLAAAGRVLLVLHVRPDGDSIGSALAMARALHKMGKEAEVVAPDVIPPNLAFVPGAEAAVGAGQTRGHFDTALFLDCASLDRIGGATADLSRAGPVLNVDHHSSNQRYGEVNYIEPHAAACGEVTYDLIHDLGVALDPDIALGLYVAIVTDTGSFRYQSVTARTHRIAAELLEHGVKPAEVGRRIWDSRTVASVRLEAAALTTLTVEGELAWMDVTPPMLASTGAAAYETEGLVNVPRSLEGVEVAVLFTDEGAGEVRVSLRSTQRVDVSTIAVGLGGGGHARAAGCTLRMGLEEAHRAVLGAVRSALR